jgi:hypothetical protein
VTLRLMIIVGKANTMDQRAFSEPVVRSTSRPCGCPALIGALDAAPSGRRAEHENQAADISVPPAGTPTDRD